MASRITAEVFPGASNPQGRSVGAWYIRLVAPNHEILATSEQYYSKWNAERAIRKFSVPYTVVER
jgi:Domain of unknown function (DUF1508)